MENIEQKKIGFAPLRELIIDKRFQWIVVSTDPAHRDDPIQYMNFDGSLGIFDTRKEAREWIRTTRREFQDDAFELGVRIAKVKVSLTEYSQSISE